MMVVHGKFAHEDSPDKLQVWTAKVLLLVHKEDHLIEDNVCLEPLRHRAMATVCKAVGEGEGVDMVEGQG